LFIFRRRDKPQASEDFVRVPGHPYTTGVFVLACWSLVISTLVASPLNAGIGVVILGLGGVVYFLWARKSAAREQE
jgi:basic amino acid/polyamine antiporter, APA family